MLKAQQHQLAQAANNDLVAIRTNEINYYVQFFTNFGTQCALIAGFQLSSISQVPTWDTSNDIGYVYLYWVSTCICICISLHVLLCTVYATVFGQGLALRGPAGSMVRAVDGMMAEQKQILITFSVNIFLLGVSTVATYYVVMDIWGAHVCTIITVIAMFFWHRYCLRIYNRFKWVETPTNWTEEEGREGGDDGMDFEKYAAQKYAGKAGAGVIHAPDSPVLSTDRGHGNGSRRHSKQRKKSSAFFPRIFGRKKERSNSRSSSNSKDVDDRTRQQSYASHGAHSGFNRAHSYNAGHEPHMDVAVRSGAGYGMSNVTHQGYITVAEPGVFGENLKRRYMLLVENRLLWYETKRDYEINPEKSVNKRPVYVDSYIVSSTRLPGNMFGITLTPDARATDGKRVFNFRCDTIDELTSWAEAFRTVIRPKSMSQHAKSNLLLGASDLSPTTGGWVHRAGAGDDNGSMASALQYSRSPVPRGRDSDDDDCDDAGTVASHRKFSAAHRHSANTAGEESASLLQRTPSDSSFHAHGNNKPYI